MSDDHNSWASYDSQQKKHLKEQWKNKGTLQDSEAVHQFVKDWKKTYLTKKKEPKKRLKEQKKKEYVLSVMFNFLKAPSFPLWLQRK